LTSVFFVVFSCKGGAGFVVPVAGAIGLMSGTVSAPAWRRIDVGVETGEAIVF